MVLTTPLTTLLVIIVDVSCYSLLPGPGSYNIFSYGIANESLKKANQESFTKPAFGSSASRAFYISNKDAVWTPGPGHYVVSFIVHHSDYIL